MHKCPYCYIEAKTIHGLKKHLSGTIRYGGHELNESEINDIVSDISGLNYSTEKKNPKTNSEILIMKPNDPSGLFIYDLFVSLLKNKDIPKYQFERRIDTIFELFLPDILSQYYEGEVVFVAPEFPLKKDQNNQSTNVDYLFFLNKKNGDQKWIMLELKTDHDSVSYNQIDIYSRSIIKGMSKIIDELQIIRKNSIKKHKYNILLENIEKFHSDCPIEIIYLSSFKINSASRYPDINFLTFSDLLDFKPSKYAEVWNMFREIIIKNL